VSAEPSRAAFNCKLGIAEPGPTNLRQKFFPGEKTFGAIRRAEDAKNLLTMAGLIGTLRPDDFSGQHHSGCQRKRRGLTRPEVLA
jgi:hypothetical protein